MRAPETNKSDFHLDLYASSKSARPALYLVSAVSAVLLLAAIIALLTTNMAAWVLPMDDAYLQILVPKAGDGAEPLSLRAVRHEVADKTLKIAGSVENRADQPITELLAVISAQETTGRFGQTIEVPVTPAEVAPRSIGNFETSVTLQEIPISFSVKFRLLDGPFIPHKDERAYQIAPF